MAAFRKRVFTPVTFTISLSKAVIAAIMLSARKNKRTQLESL